MNRLLPESLQELSSDIAQAGVDASTVHRIITVLIEHRGGTYIYIPKCSYQSIVERNELIRQQARLGMSNQAIAEQHRLSVRTIERILNP